MAHRDKSQGFGFVWADIKTLLAQRNELEKHDQWDPIEIPKKAEKVNLNKDSVVETPAAPAPAVEATAAPTPSVEQIKENLDRLAKLHQKLHVMLDEINRMNAKKSSDN